MFHSKKTPVDFKRATQKFLDAKKDSRYRAHALRILLDNFETHEAKVFFQRYYSEIYYICHDYFSIVEVNLRQKANKSVREDLDGVLHIFEKILILLPELVRERWQFGSIGRTMQKLLHCGNAFKLRSEGIRLLILWLQTLQDNMDISCEVMFACAVPGFPNPLEIIDTSNVEVPVHVLKEICTSVRGPEQDVAHASGSMTLLPQEAKDSGSSNWCTRDEVQVLVPLISQNQTEKISGLEDLTKVYLDRVLDYMITQIGKIEWLDKSMRMKGFECLFNLFKKYYLHHVFPMWNPSTNLYATESEDQVQEIVVKTLATPNHLEKYADSVVKWFVAFTSKIKRVTKVQNDAELAVSQSTSQSTDSLNSGASETQALTTTTEQLKGGPMYEDLIVAGDVIRNVIYSTRENVHIVHEVFRQGFLLPLNKNVIIREVLAVYCSWVKNEKKPKFMHEPAVDGVDSTTHDVEDVRAGLQGNVRLIIFHSSLVFLTTNLPNSLSNQVDICKRVIQLYRNIVLETPMHAKTWEQLLVVLLTIAEHVLKDKVVEPKLSSFAGKLAPVLLQTLFVTWIRANLSVTVSVELWDRFLDVASCVTHWSEVVSEWKQTMDTLTSVIARRVYGLNLNDLPLDRLSEQKHKKRRHRLQSLDKTKNIAKSKVLPTPSVQESKPESVSSSAATNVALSQGKGVEEIKNEGSPLLTAESQGCKSISDSRLVSLSLLNTHAVYIEDLPKEPEYCEQTSTNLEEDGNPQMTTEQESEKGYESDVTDTGSELSFETAAKSMQGDTDMSLNSLSSTYGGGGSRDLDGDKNSLTLTGNEDAESVDDNSSRSTIENGKNQSVGFTELDGKRKVRCRRGVKAFWKDSDGLEEISSDGEIPSSFSNPIHDETAFESVIPATTPLEASTVPLEIVEPSVRNLEIETEMSVVCGGTKEGWSPVTAVVLWCRMLGVLGNINSIESATIHAQVLESLSQIWRLLEKIRLNQGISEDNKSTPSVPQLLPPLHYFSSWLFQAANLSQKYKNGRLIAYQLLCSMTVRRQDNPLSEDYLRHFYRCLHDGLTGTDQDIINAIMGKCDKFFAMVLPSSSLLILDFISAANTIIDSTNTEYPRTEAVTILASLLCYPNAFPNMKIYQIGSSPLGEQESVTLCRDLKDKVSDALYKVARTDPDCHARCTALSAIGIFIVEELTYQKGDSRLLHYTSLLLTSILFKNWSVSSVAIGIIRNLSEYHEQLSDYDADLPLKVLQVLCEIIMRCVSDGSLMDTSHGVKVLNPLLSCLLDWVMVIPLSALTRVSDENDSTLDQVFQALKFVVTNKSTKTARDFNINRMISREDLQIHLGQIHQDIVDFIPSGPADISDSESGNSVLSFQSQTMNRVKTTAKAVILHIVNHLNHFPLSAGAARLTSIVNENQDNVYCSEQQELTPAIFSSPNVQFFVLNDSSLLSLVELPLENGSTSDQDILCGNTTTRLIVRDMCGKHCLDISTLFGPSLNNGKLFPGVLERLFDEEELREIFEPDHGNSVRPQSAETLHQPDKLDELLKDVGSTSPECLFYPHLSLNEPAPTPHPLNEEDEDKLIKAIETQRKREEEYCQNALKDQSLKGTAVTPNDYQEPNNPFHLSHFLFNQLGMFGWEKRKKIDLLKKSDKLVRELKHLDNGKSRETHKIAVFYVAPGQEDKTSIMSNTSGSKEYEDFVAGLAWEVELSTHSGFMGGLDKNQSTGNTAAYYGNSTVEIMFHVATRMPVSTDEGGFIKKVRHLGNDEIWIVWSEHSRDFRHGIVNAEFGDVVIAIYPLKNHLLRIQILKKGEIPYFGPLFDGAVVDRRVLPSLVRMTAVNASRAKRSLIPGMQTYYEERASCISNIVNKHKENTVFEDFAEQVFSPVPRKPEENAQLFSFSSYLRHSGGGGEPSPASRRDGYSTLPSKRMTKTAAEKDPISSTVSLPDGLHRVSQSDTLAQKMDKKRMSLRRKLAQSAKEDTSE